MTERASSSTPAARSSAAADSDRQARALSAEEQEAAHQARLQQLYARIHERKDFPSLRDTIVAIQKVVRSDRAHMRALADEVLQDVGLTNKLLRLINAAFYSAVGGGTITTVQRAIALMGFEPVGRLAASLAFFDRLPPGADGDRVRREFSLALLGATLARQLLPNETVYVTALFQNLGNMLAWLHFPDDAQDIEDKAEALREAHPDKPVQRDKLEADLLGLSYEDLGVEIARQWGWPESLLHDMRPRIPENLEAPCAREHLVQVLCTAANRLAVRCEQLSAEEIEACAQTFAIEWGAVLGLDAEGLAKDIETSLGLWREMELVLGLKCEAAPLPAGAIAPRSGTMRQALNQGLKSLARMSVTEPPMEMVYQSLLQTLMSALELQRAMVLLLEFEGPARLTVRNALGDRIQVVAPLFQVPMAPPVDLFGLLAHKGSDTLISDTEDPSIAKRLPLWFRTRMRANTFLVLPMHIDGRPAGLLYGDRAEPNSLVIGEREFELLSSMRDVLVQLLEGHAARRRGA
jgi:HD-like signal output (HDOD) protein